MKKVFYILAIAVMAFGFVSCDNNLKSENRYSEEYIQNALKFVGQGVLPQPDAGQLTRGVPSNLESMVVFRVATRDGGCRFGIGLCKVVITPTNLYYIPDPNTVYLSFESIDFDNWVIELAEVPQIDMSGIRFRVEEDVYVKDVESGVIYAVVRANEYVFDRTVGTAGGFRLTSEALNP